MGNRPKALQGLPGGPPVPNLGIREVTLTDAMKREAELRAGMRCFGCGDRFERGFEFVVFRAVSREGRVLVEEHNTFACAKPEGDCGYFVKAAAEAIAMKVVGWTFLDTEKAQEVLRRDDAAPPDAAASG